MLRTAELNPSMLHCFKTSLVTAGKNLSPKEWAKQHTEAELKSGEALP